jgi:succinate dehydrogenase / fumarate reductase, iron-sulfur subunit
MNAIVGLMDIAANPVDRLGNPTTPVNYESNCLEEVCVSCAMLINGKAAMACSSLINKLEQPVRLEPLSRFPVIRDLAVDRSVLFENLKRVKAWVPVDGTYDLGAGPRISPKAQEEMYPLSRCISCCLDLQQPWQRFNTEHELTTKGIEKFVADYRATLYQAAS